LWFRVDSFFFGENIVHINICEAICPLYAATMNGICIILAEYTVVPAKQRLHNRFTEFDKQVMFKPFIHYVMKMRLSPTVFNCSST
jgi:hypothetical protein